VRRGLPKWRCSGVRGRAGAGGSSKLVPAVRENWFFFTGGGAVRVAWVLCRHRTACSGRTENDPSAPCLPSKECFTRLVLIVTGRSCSVRSSGWVGPAGSSFVGGDVGAGGVWAEEGDEKVRTGTGFPGCSRSAPLRARISRTGSSPSRTGDIGRVLRSSPIWLHPQDPPDQRECRVRLKRSSNDSD